LSASNWPKYVIDNGYAIAAPSGTGWGGIVSSIVNFLKPAANTAYANMCNAIGDRYDSHPLMEMFDPMGESTWITFDAGAWDTMIPALFVNVKPHWPTTLLRLQANWSGAQSSDSAFLTWYAILRNLGGCCVGGPDPNLSDNMYLTGDFLAGGTNAMRVFRGYHWNGSGAGSNPDMRLSNTPWCGEIQEDGFGGPHLTKGAPGIFHQFECINPAGMCGYHIIWSVEEYLAIKFTPDVLPYINSTNGVSRAGVPPQGNWFTG
jgi:hypothetical protein